MYLIVYLSCVGRGEEEEVGVVHLSARGSVGRFSSLSSPNKLFGTVCIGFNLFYFTKCHRLNDSTSTAYCLYEKIFIPLNSFSLKYMYIT